MVKKNKLELALRFERYTSFLNEYNKKISNNAVNQLDIHIGKGSETTSKISRPSVIFVLDGRFSMFRFCFLNNERNQANK